jgi:cytochrome c biogenesis protein CcmG/thiol:disulfide interchange protein DsbE
MRISSTLVAGPALPLGQACCVVALVDSPLAASPTVQSRRRLVLMAARRLEEDPPLGRDTGSRLLRTGAILAAVAFVALLSYGLVAQAPEIGIDDSLIRQPAPPAPGFDLPILHPGSLGQSLEATVDASNPDGTVSLAELRGTPVVLNFWASWCIPCREEAPLLERQWRRARSSGVLFVGLNMQDITDNAREFIQEFGITFLNVRDNRKDVARQWGVTGIPGRTRRLRAPRRDARHSPSDEPRCTRRAIGPRREETTS